ALGRTHQPEDSGAAVAVAREARLDVNLDLIFGWPGQTVAAWESDLDIAAALGPDHVSCYPLELRLDPDGSIPNWPGGGWPVLERYAARFGDTAATRVRTALRAVEPAHLVQVRGRHARLTARGRLLASEVFIRLLP